MCGLIVVFYYTRCRAGLFIGGATVLLSLLLVLGRLTFARFTVVVLVGIVSLVLVSQIDFIASRFADDPSSTNNISERLDTILSGLHALLAYPFGLGVNEFDNIVWSETGLPTPHNGFIFFGGVFGLLALSALLVIFAASLRARNDTDMFFVFLTMQVSLSFLFEQLSGSPSFAFATCLIAGHSYLGTRFGGELVGRTPGRISRRSLVGGARRRLG